MSKTRPFDQRPKTNQVKRCQMPPTRRSREQTMCFSQSAMPESIRVKTNHVDRDNTNQSQTSGNVSRLIKHFDSQARPTSDSLKPRAHVQPQSEACCVPRSGQERTRSGQPSRSGSAFLGRPQRNEDSIRTGPAIRGSFSRTKMDQVARPDLREQPKAGTCQVPPLCEPASVRRINLDAHQQSDDHHGKSLPAPFCSGASGPPNGNASGIGTLRIWKNTSSRRPWHTKSSRTSG